MARRADHNGGGKTVTAAATTVTFTASDVAGSVPGAAVVKYVFITETATAASAQNLLTMTRARLKANGVTFMDLGQGATTAMNELQAFLETFNWANAAPGIIASTRCHQWSIPLFIPDASSENLQDVSAFPMGATPTIELTFGAATNASTIYAGWITSDIAPRFSPSLLGSQMNIAAGVNSGRYPIVEDGKLRAVGVPIGGLRRFRLVLGGEQRVNIMGRPNTVAVSAESGSMFVELDSDRSPNNAGFSGGSITGNATVNNSGFHYTKLVGMQTAPPGNSFVELDTNATDWAGAANELVIYSLRGQIGAPSLDEE